MIKLTAIGNLGRDSVTNEVNGRHVINFSVAHTERFKDQEKTIWIECAYWTEKLGIAPYLKKGTTVYVEGSPDIRQYQTNDGRQGASLTLRVQSVQLVGGKNSNGDNNEYSDSNNNTPTYNNSNTSTTSNASLTNNTSVNDNQVEDDLPF